MKTLERPYVYPDHDGWLHWDVTYRCNLNCAYCFAASNRKWPMRIFKNRRITRPIDIPALLASLNRAQKTFLITFTGSGEPFLVGNLTEACLELTRKHYVSVNTNLTLPQTRNFARRIDPQRVFFVHASFHFHQLVERRLLDTFLNHFVLFRDRGFNIYADAVAYPPLFIDLDRLRSLFDDLGSGLKLSPFIGIFDRKRYPQAYTTEERRILGFGSESSGLEAPMGSEDGRLCNAGYNVVAVHPSGCITKCVHRRKRLGRVYEGIPFQREMTVCRLTNCTSPLCEFDRLLFRKALAA